jgi:hypothetical protein
MDSARHHGTTHEKCPCGNKQKGEQQIFGPATTAPVSTLPLLPLAVPRLPVAAEDKCEIDFANSIDT